MFGIKRNGSDLGKHMYLDGPLTRVDGVFSWFWTNRMLDSLSLFTVFFRLGSFRPVWGMSRLSEDVLAWHFVTLLLHVSQTECVHSTLYTLHSTLHTPHFTLYTPHSTLHTLNTTLHTLHPTLHTLHVTLHTLHTSLHTLHTSLHTLHSPLYTPHFTLHTPHFTPYIHTFHFTVHTPHFTLHTSHSHLIPVALTCVSFTWFAFGFVGFSCFFRFSG